MSWLSEWWRRIKGGRTDAEVAFEFIVSRMSARQRNDLAAKLYAVQFCIDQSHNSDDPRVRIAGEWVTGALRILEGRK